MQTRIEVLSSYDEHSPRQRYILAHHLGFCKSCYKHKDKISFIEIAVNNGLRELRFIRCTGCHNDCNFFISANGTDSFFTAIFGCCCIPCLRPFTEGMRRRVRLIAAGALMPMLHRVLRPSIGITVYLWWIFRAFAADAGICDRQSELQRQAE